MHEAFGHLSESDHIYENDTLRDMMVLGKQFGSPILDITDGAAVPGHRGSYRYDDEGTPASLTPLIREGVLVGRLHSRETAGKMGELNGNARECYRFRPCADDQPTLRTATTENDLDIDEGIRHRCIRGRNGHGMLPARWKPS